MDRNPGKEIETVDLADLGKACRRAISHWPAIVALLLIAAAYLTVYEGLAPILRWVLFGIVVTWIAAIFLALRRGHHLLGRGLGIGLIAVVTLVEVTSTLLLVMPLLSQHSAGSEEVTSTLSLAALLHLPELPATELLRNAAIIWSVNVVTFALWYWVVDGGGPRMRHERPYEARDFLFPQQQRDEKEHWCPSFIDYLFLAFNHSTAFSPTDTLILSHRAKVLVMIQALLSLVTIAVLAARAINTLNVVAQATSS